MTAKAIDPTVWNPKWTLMQKLRRLRAIDPDVLRAVEMLVDDALQRLGQRARCPADQP
jgi:hypothetical protein